MSEADPKTRAVVHAKCRRGQDRLTEGTSCSSLRAYNLSGPGARTAAFKCAVCNYEWTVAVGGEFKY